MDETIDKGPDGPPPTMPPQLAPMACASGPPRARRPKNRPVKNLSHDEREKAIRIAGEMLLRRASSSTIKLAIDRELSLLRGKDVDLGRKSVDGYIAAAQKRAAEYYGRPREHLAAEQVHILRQVQAREFAKGTTQASRIVVDASKGLCRLLGLDRPTRVDLHLVNQQQDKMIEVLAEMLTPEQLEQVVAKLKAAEGESNQAGRIAGAIDVPRLPNVEGDD